MSDLTVVWEEEALKLLEERDRFTRNAIRQEFGRDPKKDAIQFDPDHATYATPVSDRRFSVVWRWKPEDRQVVVRAVVPLTNMPVNESELRKPEDLVKLKDYIWRAVEVESKGEIRP